MGTVGFGSGLQGWAFTLKDFAVTYAQKFKIKEDKLMKKFWGDNFFQPSTNKWQKNGDGGAVRGFCKFILEPIYKVSLHIFVL